MMMSFLRFLTGPVFSYIQPFNGRQLTPTEMVNVVQVLAWTAPMAALLYKRLNDIWNDQNRPLSEEAGRLATADIDNQADAVNSRQDGTVTVGDETGKDSANGSEDGLEPTQVDKVPAEPAPTSKDAAQVISTDEFANEFGDTQELRATAQLVETEMATTS
jgi:hypothetical protein